MRTAPGVRRSSCSDDLRPSRGATLQPPLLLIGVIAAGLLYPVATDAVTLTFAPTADSYVTNASGQTTTNFGTATTFAVGVTPTRHAFVMFNVTGLTGAPTSATLKLWAVSASGGSSAKSTTTVWTETGINNTNAPAIGSTAVSTVGTVTAGTWATFTVTTLIAGNGLVAIAFTSASTAGVVFASREDAAHAPQLTVIAPAGSAPGAPTGVSAVGGNGQATVSWIAPASDGGSPITAYTVTSNPGSLTCGTTGTLTCPVTGLTNGTRTPSP